MIRNPALAFFYGLIRRGPSFALLVMSALRGALVSCALILFTTTSSAIAAQTDAVQEYQVKAVFLFNFTHFVGWPQEKCANANSPMVIGILGDDPFGHYLDDAIRGETIGERPLIVRRYHHLEDVGDCQILFISRSETSHYDQIAAHLKDHSILTVSDADQSGKRSGIVEFVTKDDRVKLRVDVNSAKDAGLTISSKLLRVAEVVGNGVDP